MKWNIIAAVDTKFDRRNAILMEKKRFDKWNATAAYMLLHFPTWGFYAVITGFSTNVLYDFGFTDSQVSLLLGISTAVAFVLQLGLAELVNRFRIMRVWYVLVGLGLAMLMCNIVVGLPGAPVWAAIAAFGIACMIVQIVPSFSNAIGMDAIKRGSPTDYSMARGVGSMGYCSMSFVTGRMVSALGSAMVPVLGGLCALMLIAGTVWYHFAGERDLKELAPEVEQRKRSGSFLGQYPRFAVFLAASVVLLIGHNLPSNFMYQIMLVKNGGAAEQGLANSITALAEIPVMFLFPLLMRRVRCDKWLRFSCIFFAVKALGLFLADDPGAVYAAQATQMLGYGLYAISSVNYAEMVVGEGESIRAQSYLMATNTVSTLIAVSLGGVICQYFGAQIMVLIALAAVSLGGITIILTAQKTKQ